MAILKEDSRKNLNYSLMVSVFLLAMLVYANSLSVPFHYDDYHHIVGNHNIRSLKNIPLFFSHPEMFTVDERFTMYRPLLMVSHTLNYYFGGEDPWGYHLVNISLHAINSVLIYLIFSSLINRSSLIVLLGSLLYAVNPINTEGVNYISSRSNVMTATFYLLAFYLYIKSGIRSQKPEDKRRFTIHDSRFTIYYLLALFLYACGLLTKEIAVTLPLILLLYDFILRGSKQGTPTNNQEIEKIWHLASGIWHLGRHLPFWVVTFLYLMLRKVFMGATSLKAVIPSGLVIDTVRGTAGEVTVRLSRAALYQLTQVKVILNYIRLWFVPVGLNIAHDYPLIKGWKEPVLWLYIFVFASLLIIIILLLYKRERLMVFFMLWFLITILPTSLLSLNIVMAENRVYLPGIGLAGFITTVLGRFMGKEIEPLRRKGIILVLLISIMLGSYSIGTIIRNRVWQDELTLWGDSVKKSSGSAWSYFMLGEAYMRREDIDHAIDNYLISIKLNPNGFLAHNNLGLAYSKKGEMEKAYKAIKEAIRLKPNFVEAYYNMGNYYSRLEQYSPAKDAYLKAIEIRHNYSEAHNNLGNVYWLLGDLNMAREEYISALEANPFNAEASENLNRVIQILSD